MRKSKGGNVLVLSRKENESIIINNEIEIKIIHIKPDQVKIGIVAPKEVRIFRQEIFEEIMKENQKAQQAGSISDLKELMKKKDKK